MKTILLAIIFINLWAISFAQSKEILYIGTFSHRQSKGIYVIDYERDTQKSTLLQTVSDGLSPSFLELHPNGKFLYAVYRAGEPKQDNTGSIVAYRIDPTSGLLTKINQQSSEGADPCHVSVDPLGRFAFVSNYKQGNVVAYPIGADGSVAPASGQIQHVGKSINPQRQEAPHTHSAIPAADGRFVYVSDLGIDKIMIYQVNATDGRLSAARPAFVKATAGAGPRHFTIHTNQRWAYSLEELTSTLVMFKRSKKTGAMIHQQRISILPEKFSAESKAADLHITPNGRFLFASNRGHDKLGVFEIHPQTGQLTRIGFEECRGQEPRNFLIDKKGEWLFLANQNTDNVMLFQLNQTTGQLVNTNQALSIPAPVCVKQLFLK